MYNITVVGAGYVGLVTGVCFSKKGNAVTIVEKNEEKIKALLSGNVPFYEPGLDELLKESLQKKTLFFTTSIKEAMQQDPAFIFSCVGTPSNNDGSADLSYVFNVAHEIGAYLNKYCVVVNKSTVPVGTSYKVKTAIERQLKQRNVFVGFDVASNPEFLKEGDALSDFLQPDRIAIGTTSIKAQRLFLVLYKPFVATNDQIIFTDVVSAELSKYASNTMLATRISFMNQMALLAGKTGADIEMVKKVMEADKRIGKHFLNAGIGYGGSCFPKDVQALVHTGRKYQQPMTLVEEVENINNQQRSWFTEKIINFYGSSIGTKKIGIWGLAFKPETDDVRCAPSIDVIKKLLKAGATIYAYDPVAQKNMNKLFGNSVNFAATAQSVLESSDALIILTEWQEFLKIDIAQFKKLKDNVVFDARNCFDLQQLFDEGINYISVGRNNTEKKKEKEKKRGIELLQH
jgi:UDPglucose 6-dehydrogenase